MSAQKSYIDNNGKLAIPIKLRKMLHLKARDKVVIDCVDNKLVITSFREKLEHARALVKKYTSNISLVDELKKMRQEDASKE